MRIPALRGILEKQAKARDYKEEYREYHGRPEQIKERAQRNAARAKLGLKVGIPGRPITRGPSRREDPTASGTRRP